MKKHEVRVLIRDNETKIEIEHRPRVPGATELESIKNAKAIWKDCLVFSIHRGTAFAGWRM